MKAKCLWPVVNTSWMSMAKGQMNTHKYTKCTQMLQICATNYLVTSEIDCIAPTQIRYNRIIRELKTHQRASIRPRIEDGVGVLKQSRESLGPRIG